MKELQLNLNYTHFPALQIKLSFLDSVKIESWMKIFDTNKNNILKFQYFLSNSSKQINDLTLLLDKELKQLEE